MAEIINLLELTSSLVDDGFTENEIDEILDDIICGRSLDAAIQNVLEETT